MTADSARFLVGDVGGTKTIVALYDRKETAGRLACEVYPSRAHATLDSILSAFREAHPGAIDCAAFAVAGPVSEGHATVTHLPWGVDAKALERRHSIPRVILMNDLEALATAVPSLAPGDTHTIAPGQPATGGVIAVVAPGTGLGEAYLTWNGVEYVAHASEGGHSDFAPTTRVQARLLEFLLREHDHVSTEQVCSGLGLPNLYRFLRDDSHLDEAEWLREELESVEDQTPTIIAAGVDGRSRLCVRTLELFSEILGAEVGNVALRLLATGGVYLGGGIPPRVLPFLESEAFLNAVRRKGRFESVLRRVPICVIRNPDTVLRGAALLAAESCAD